MKLGAEPKKVAVLAGLVVVALAIFIYNSSSSDMPPGAATASRPAAGVPASPVGIPQDANAAAPASGAGAAKKRGAQEFRPKLRSNRPEERPDPMSIDPTLRLDVLARLQNLTVSGAHRSLFDFGQGPPPTPDAAKPATAKVKAPSPIVPIQPQPSTAANVQPPKPQAPPIPLKFYGFVNPSGDSRKRAFFVEGDEIHIVSEGDLVKRRYRVVRIGVSSVVVEDTQFRSEQTLPLEEQPG